MRVNSGQPSASPDADSLNQHVDDLKRLCRVKAQIVKGALRNIGKRAAALLALVTLETFMLTEPDALAFAVVTDHLTFPGQSLN
jgi:hypothetical protein